MDSTVRMATGLALAALTLAVAGCSSSHSGSRAGSTSSTAPTTAASTPATSSGAPASTAPASTAVPAAKGCLAGQLAVQVGAANGAAGSVGYTNSFENASGSTCTLFGYPGMQMLDASGHPLPTHVIRGTSVTVPYVAEKLVTLAPGGKAYFHMGFAASTGYGNAQCPTSARVEFTPPNDFQSLTVPLAIRPYGGPTIAQLNCGEITVSPVYAVG